MTTSSREFDWRQFLVVGLQMAGIVLAGLLGRIAASLLWVYTPGYIPVVVHDTATMLVKWTAITLAVVYGVEKTR